MKKLKLFFAALALLVGANSASAQPTASTPVVGNTYYLYNPTTKLFMTTNVSLPFIRPIGSAWKLENGAQDGYVTLRLKDNTTDGCGYFWGKWWANDPAGNSNDYSGEREFKLVNTSGANYKLQSYAWGASNAFIYINKGNEGDRSYRLACNSHEQGGLDEGFMTWQFISEEDYATYMSMDYTSSITNNDFLSGTSNWTLEGSGNKQTHGNTAIEYWVSSAKNGSFDYYQNITVPAGKYVLRAAMYNSTNGETGASFNVAGQCGVYGTSGGTTKHANVTVDGTAYNIYTTEDLLVGDGNLRLGFKNSTTMTARWFGVDWIQLTCTEYCVSGVATALPANGQMEADKWYKYTITVTGSYTISATNPANIIETTSGSQLLGEATGSAVTTGDDVELTEGDVIYYKSSVANTLTIEANVKTYVVGAATANISYIQKDNTVTISWNEATTNDGDAEFAKNGSPTITLNGNAVDIETTAKGFSFTVPDGLTANTEYTLAIPANAFGYAAGSTYNEAQNITLKTPAILDGFYYLKTSANKYLSRGGSYNTQAIADNYGIPMRVTTNSSGITEFIFIDNWFHLFDANSGNLFTDNNTANNFAVVPTEGGYYVVNKNTTANSTYDGKVYLDTSDGNRVKVATNGDATVWIFEDATTSAHKTQMQALKDAQAATVATSAGISASTQAALASELETNYLENNISITGTNGTNSQSWQQGASNSTGNELAVFAEEEVTGLTPGLYCLSVKAFERITWYNDVANAGGAAGLTYLYANDQKVQLHSLLDYSADASLAAGDVEINGKYYPDTQASAQAYFDAGKYINVVYVNVTDEGDGTGSIRFGIKKPHRYGNDGSRGAWICYNNFTLTRYDKKVGLIGLNGDWSDDILMTHSEGNNYTKTVTNFPAKAGINYEYKIRDYGTWDSFQFPASGKGNKSFSVAEDGLYTLVFTANISTGAVTVEKTRTADLTGVVTFVNVAGWDKDKLYAYAWTGEEKNATWPGLKIEKVGTYQGYDVFAYIYATKHDNIIFSEKDSDSKKTEDLEFTDGEQYANGTMQPYYTVTYTNPGSWSNVYAYTWTTKGGSDKNATWPGIAMTPTENGYVYGVHAENAPTKIIFNDNGSNQTDNLKFYDGLTYDFAAKGGTVAITISSAGYRTYASAATLNFAGSDITAYRAEKSEGNITFTEHEWVPAGTGLLLKAEPGTYNIPTVTSDDEDYAVSSELTGIVKPTLVEGAGIFVLMDGAEGVGFYKTTAAAFTVGANTAYLPASVAEGRLFIGLDIDGETTGISTVNSQELNANSYYNLNGQRIMAPSKGLYIMNGKKVVVK